MKLTKLGDIILVDGKQYMLVKPVNSYSCAGCAGYGKRLCNTVLRRDFSCADGIWQEVPDATQASVPATPPATPDPMCESIDRLIQLWDAKASCDDFEAELENLRKMRKQA